MRRLFSLCLVFFAVLSLSACEEEVEPFVEDNRFFSIYGYLDTASDQQFVRVVPLRRTLNPEGDLEIDATVSSIEVETGQTVVWSDSLITYANGSFGHVYHAPFRPIPGFTYRFLVERSDGAMAEAVTTVPPAENVRIGTPTLSGDFVAQDVFWEDIDFPPFRVEMWYRFINTPPSAPFLNAVVVYDGSRFGEAKDGGWEVTVRPDVDRLLVLDQFNVSEDARLSLLGLGMRLTMSDAQWRPPGGVFNREILVQPGTFSNVEGGFGFLGAVNQYTTEWVLSPEVTEALGYAFPGKR